MRQNSKILIGNSASLLCHQHKCVVVKAVRNGSQNNWVCTQNAGAADNMYLLFISSQLCTTALSWEECVPGDGFWPVSVGGCVGGLLLAVSAALGSVWVLSVSL